jgi:hypothetical protein
MDKDEKDFDYNAWNVALWTAQGRLNEINAEAWEDDRKSFRDLRIGQLLLAGAIILNTVNDIVRVVF